VPGPTTVFVAQVVGTAASIPFSNPGVLTDDIILLCYQYANTITPPSGFALAADGGFIAGNFQSARLYWKRASGEPGTWTATLNTAGEFEAVMMVIRGCLATGNPWSFTPQVAQSPSAGTTLPAVSGTTVDANELLVNFACNLWTGVYTPSSGFTQRIINSNNVVAGSDKPQAAAGATGAVTGSHLGSNLQSWNFLIALRPSTGSADQTYLELGADVGAVNDAFALEQIAGGTDGAIVLHGASGDNRATFPGLTTSVYHHVLIELDRSAAGAGIIREVRLDGAVVTLTRTATNVLAGNFGNRVLNAMARNGALRWVKGRLGEVAIWNSAAGFLSGTVKANLALGVRADAVGVTPLHYWKNDGNVAPEPDTGSAAHVALTVLGAAPQIAGPPYQGAIAGPSAAVRAAFILYARP
jgi:hypothetical protein